MALPLVLLFGRTNVGKSTLFNRLSHSRMAVVYDQPGVTRDFLETVIDRRFRLMDSGGLFMPTDTFSQTVEARVENALHQAAVVVWVVDGRAGLVPMEHTLAEAFRKWKKLPILTVNKVDRADDESHLADFYRLGWPVMVPISAEHNRGIDDLKAAIVAALSVGSEGSRRQPDVSDAIGENPLVAKNPLSELATGVHGSAANSVQAGAVASPSIPVVKPIRFVVLGRPNVGKSSLTNAFLKEERVLVSEVAGTTRDAVECPFTWKFHDGTNANFVLVDTAGVRKKTADPVEFYAAVRRQSALEASDLAIVLLDATVGPTCLDKTLLSAVWDAGKGCLLVINKWDIAREWCRREQKSAAAFEEEFKTELRRVCPFIDAPIVFVSAQTQEGLDGFLQQVQQLWQRLSMPLTTGALNRCLQTAQKKQPPPLVLNRKRFKLYYAVQLNGLPITLKVFCNRVAWLPPPYIRFLERQVRRTFHLEGCPLRWEWMEKTQRLREM